MQKDGGLGPFFLQLRYVKNPGSVFMPLKINNQTINDEQTLSLLYHRMGTQLPRFSYNKKCLVWKWCCKIISWKYKNILWNTMKL
ncbi:hypothetical protein C4B25_00495 [Mycoplasma todarodis]|uniref:Uncharacterized protein n=1 Tax=Mycoplasma todarodis TaxID=1937191 RepID=A0A4R0XQU8_9MOLU|nr:hypothetical protein C4B25_00495 [Mycoplasma todarodis]